MLGGIAAAVGNSATGLVFDIAESNGLEALPWILLTLVGLASAAAVMVLESLGKCRGRKGGAHRRRDAEFG